MLDAFPGAPLHTSLFNRTTTFPEFADANITTLALDRVGALRRSHRLALPFLAPAFSTHHVEADVVMCSSSGWSHGLKTEGRKVVYCHSPARWLYQRSRYLGPAAGVTAPTLAALRPWLVAWDRRAAQSAHRYLTNSTLVQRHIRSTYGIDAEILPPPPALGPAGPRRPLAGIDPGFFLCVSRLLPYKNVDAVVAAFGDLRAHRLVIVGEGPDRAALESTATANVRFLGAVADDALRWLYSTCEALVSASYEDFGLATLEAAGFGRPAAALRWGGFLDTVVDGGTGLFFDEPSPAAIRASVALVHRHIWDSEAIRAHAARFSPERFVRRLREVVAEEAALT
jgi:glycosyltransferase involved in cell wall biosynthesis